ncbi:MAG: polar amino acid transport system substrate-binding protein [Neolewinella sp.]|jgi:polar amino acid transport system substrate-binding protein
MDGKLNGDGKLNAYLFAIKHKIIFFLGVINMKLLTRTGVAVTAAALIMMLPFSVSQARDYSEIKESGVLKVSNSGAYPPFSFVDLSGNVKGFDVDVANAIAEKMGLKAEIKTTPWNGIIAALVAGKYDACICSMSDTEERRKAVDFTTDYYWAGSALYTKEDSGINSASDMNDKVMGSTLGETSNTWAVNRVKDGKNSWSNQTFQGLPDLLLALDTGRVAAIAVDDVPVAVAMKEKGYKFRRIATEGLDRYPAAITVQRNQLELKAAIQKGLDEIKADGTYAKLMDKWIGFDISK